ncbi:MAG: helix-turn-helix domain-containing protein [Chloroflexi bacterium]|nr:helix-turn-helix domain-containing protein [Chloroflexota bacterium]MBP8058572.1 helix-turn-helix domain-containing protein [Chloroflexota bacterium]
MKETDVTRAKILGVLIQDARKYARRSIEECAEVLGISAQLFKDAEDGKHIISLPELEVLAMFLGVPMAHFWGSHTLSSNQANNFKTVLQLRHRMVGVLLQQARLTAGKSLEDLAEQIGVTPNRLSRYEAGQEPMPLLHLEKLGQVLGYSVSYFTEDSHGPLARHEAEQKMQLRLEELPPAVKKFIAEPVNIAYLETAMRLSAMDVKQLRGIAEAILDITF